jgi:riboflavin biosynthesis pyrimidine reductase
MNDMTQQSVGDTSTTATNSKVTRLYPTPAQELGLKGLYLAHALHNAADESGPVVYSNYIVSLDGRIAIKHPCSNETSVPSAITNAHDWRLYQELAAQADVLLTTGRYLREMVAGEAEGGLPLSRDKKFHDLHQWRKQHGLSRQPAVAVVSGSLDLPFEQIRQHIERPVYVLTGKNASDFRLKQAKLAGVKVIQAGNGTRVEGKAMVEALVKEGFNSMYAIAGPQLLETLISEQMLDQLYLTQVNRLIGGREFDTLLESRQLQPPADFALQALYLDTENDEGISQTFAVYKLCPCTE